TYARKELAGRTWEGTPVALKLVITAIEGEERTTNAAPFRYGTGISTHGIELATNGQISSFSHSDFGTKGSGGGSPLPAAILHQLDDLLAKLPEDRERLPPLGRRFLLQASVAGLLETRVYDRANAPDDVWEILRLSHCGIGAWLPEFKPQSEIEARPFDHGGFFRLSP